MPRFRVDGAVLEWRRAGEVRRFEASDGGIRVRSAVEAVLDNPASALLGAPTAAECVVDESKAVLRVDGLEVEVALSSGSATFRDTSGVELLAERAAHFAWPGSRQYSPVGVGRYRLEQRFAAYDGEKLFGLGQHTHGRLDHKGMVIDLVQRNGEVTIPFVVSSRGYGLLWNSAAIGSVAFGVNATVWTSVDARQIDYWVVGGGEPARILGAYADATGHAPVMPDWATGFWQSKLRYRNQHELLEVSREYERRGIPVAVLVADYFSWTHLGDLRFDPVDWPDPAAMVRELEGRGTRLLVSVWPSLSPWSENYDEMRERGLLIGTAHGAPTHWLFADRGFGDTQQGVSYYDATSEEARRHFWALALEHYVPDGVRTWWLDAAEPEIAPEQPGNLRFAIGPGSEVANVYPREHARAFYEGMVALGEEPVLLIRSAWAGSQRYGALLWSGDIAPTWSSLAAQVRAGLSVAMSGLPWWTTDTAGFHGGDPSDPAYRELFLRWLQWSVFCPVLRVHGFREPGEPFAAGHSGGPNEIWAFGPELETLLTEQLALRERLRPYVGEQMRAAAATGVPVMRPLFVDHPHDPAAWRVEDAYLFGPDVLVAPVTEPGAASWQVRLPEDTDWVEVRTGAVHRGGQEVIVAVDLGAIPVFVSAEACATGSSAALALLPDRR